MLPKTQDRCEDVAAGELEGYPSRARDYFGALGAGVDAMHPNEKALGARAPRMSVVENVRRIQHSSEASLEASVTLRDAALRAERFMEAHPELALFIDDLKTLGVLR